MKKFLKKVVKNLLVLFSLNIIKTIYINFRLFSFGVAVKFPIFIYGRLKISSLSGEINILAPVEIGMIQIGRKYQTMTVSKGNAQLMIEGVVNFSKYAQIGIDCGLFVYKDAIVDFGNMSSLGSDGRLICNNRISLGDFCRSGEECTFMDTDFHQMINTETYVKQPISAPIILGNYNFIGTKVLVMKGTITPDYCTIGAISMLNKDYSSLSKNTLIAGVPAKCVKDNISRDWREEEIGLFRLIRPFN